MTLDCRLSDSTNGHGLRDERVSNAGGCLAPKRPANASALDAIYDLVNLLAGLRISRIDHSGIAHPRLRLVDRDHRAQGTSQQFSERDSEPRGLPLRSVVLGVRKTAMHLSHAPIVGAPADPGNRVNRSGASPSRRLSIMRGPARCVSSHWRYSNVDARWSPEDAMRVGLSAGTVWADTAWCQSGRSGSGPSRFPRHHQPNAVKGPRFAAPVRSRMGRSWRCRQCKIEYLDALSWPARGRR